MSILFNILLSIHVLVCLLMVLLVMMQRPKQEGLGAAFASGMMSESFGAHTTDVLQKSTRFLAISFFVLTTLLAVIKAKQNRNWVSPISPAGISENVPAPPGTGDLPLIPNLGEKMGETPPPTEKTGETAPTPTPTDAAGETPADTKPKPAETGDGSVPKGETEGAKPSAETEDAAPAADAEADSADAPQKPADTPEQ